MALVIAIAIAVAGLLLLWLLRRSPRPRPRPPGQPHPGQDPARRKAGFVFIAGSQPCEPATARAGRWMPAHRAPSLPLAGCSGPAQCRCGLVPAADRRARVRRQQSERREDVRFEDGRRQKSDRRNRENPWDRKSPR
jgi:hypothetical protein